MHLLILIWLLDVWLASQKIFQRFILLNRQKKFNQSEGGTELFSFRSRSDHDHERNLDHILEARYERDLISDHFLGGTDRKKIRSHEVESKLLHK